MANEIHISGSGVTTIGRALYINGNGIDRTKIIADSYTALINTSSGQVISVNDCCINFSVAGPTEASTGARLNNVLVDGATSQQAGGGASIIGCATLITGSTFKNCRLSGTASNTRGVIDGYPLGGTISNCLFDMQWQVINAVFCYGTTITGSTFATSSTGGVNVYNRSIATTIKDSIFVATGISFNGYSITSSNYVWVKVDGCTWSRGSISTQDPNNLLEFYGINLTKDVTISGTGRITINVDSITGTTTGTSWKINLAGSTQTVNNYGTITGCTISGKSYSSPSIMLHDKAKMTDCLITRNTLTVNTSHVVCSTNNVIKGTTISGNTRGSYGGAFDTLTTQYSTSIINSVIDGCHINPVSRSWLHFNNIWYTRVGRLYNEIYNGQYSSYAPSIRVEDGSTVSVLNNTLGDSNYCFYSPCIAVGVQSSDGTFFANNGTFTYIKKNGTSVQIKGIGTYVRIDGVNDFSPIYQLTSTTASGSGSLQYGILTATEKWLVPMPNMTTASAVVSTAITNKPVFFMNAAGAPIFGGSISLPASTTISCKYDSNIEASSVTLTGGTINVAGTGYIRGNLITSNQIFLASGAALIGTGAGSIISRASSVSATTPTNVVERAGAVTLRYIVVRNTYGPSVSGESGGGGGGGVYVLNQNVTMIGCLIQNCVSGGRGGGFHHVGATATINGCTISGCRNSGAYGYAFSNIFGASCSIANTTITGNTATNGNSAVFLEAGSHTITNCKFYDNNKSNVTTYYDLQVYSGIATISGSTINRILLSGTTASSPKAILSGTNRFSGCLIGHATASIIEIQSGATVNIQGMATNITAGTISVLGTCTIINASGTATTINVGTYHTISTAGVAS